MEEIFIPFIIFGFLYLIIKTLSETRRAKYEAGRGAVHGNSLGVGELQDLIRDAVEEANESLVERLEVLEDRQLGEGAPPLLLDELDEEEPLATPAARSRRRVP